MSANQSPSNGSRAGALHTRLLARAAQAPRVLRAARALGSVALSRALRLPETRPSKLALQGLHGRAEVLWDRWGVPHIYAGDAHDAFLAQGFLHAYDRFWQMELHRRVGAGRLSEVFGARTLEADRFLRRVGLHRAAAAEAAATTGEAREMLEAYCAGVNAFLGDKRRLPLECLLLDLQPDPWRTEDCLTWSKLMGWGLALNWDVELFRARLAEHVGHEVAAALEPPYPPGHPMTARPGDAAPAAGDPGPIARAALEALSGGGSNAWVVDGTRSASGRPLLANDPHLVPQMPSPWYEVHLECPQFRAAGASLPGAPGIIIGHNARVAWGITASMTDTQDLYLERLESNASGDQAPPCYAFAGGTRAATVVEETIAVRGAAPSVERVVVTHHGPVILPHRADSHEGYALRSTLLDSGRVAQAALGLLNAEGWKTFRDALALWDAPSVNFLYADVDGNIGYQLAGATPRRPSGSGLLPLPGWTGKHEWEGFLSLDDLPRAFNPPQGYLASANNKPGLEGEGPFIAGEWIDGYRAERIVELIHERQHIGAPDVQTAHMDTLSLPARELQRLLREWLQQVDSGGQDGAAGTRLPSGPARSLLDAFLAWDARMDAQRPEPAIYACIRMRLVRALLEQRLGEGVSYYFGMALHPLTASSSYQFRGTSAFLRLLAETVQGGRAGPLITGALEAAAQDLTQRLGQDRRRWRWGRLHTVTFGHPLGTIPVLGRLLNRGPYPLAGDGDTVHQSSYSIRTPFEANRWLPSLRFIADTSDWDRCLSVHVPGQSGRPASPHYDDLLRLWLRGEYHPMPFSRTAVEAESVCLQELMPGE